MLREEKILSQAKPVEFEFIPQRWGEYLIEVSHNKQDGKGHTASRFFNASYWGRTKGGMQSAGAITLKTDKPVYHPGENAEVTFPVPSQSMILVSIEKGDKIIDSYWYKPGKKQTTGSISIPITKEMLPNIYCSISVIQPHQQTDNDRPIRMYGVIPINVEDEKTRREITLNLPEKLRPNEKFTCKIQTKDKTKTQFTIAVVDEGLLSLTDFQTPDPWKEFFKKIFLGVKTYDNYGYIIGANKGDVFKIFSIGGGLGLETYRKGQQAPEKTKRFKPVCMFKGPMETNDKGFAEVEFEMPEYIGAVRIMVISADKGRFGSTSKTVPVKKELMILPTLPRMLAPMDKFSIPVEVFAMEDGIKSVNVSISIQGPIKILKETEKTVTFDKAGDKSVYFSAEVFPEVGTAKITINARSEKYNAQSITDIAIRPYSPRIYSQEEKKCSPGESVTFLVPDDGIKGTNNATLTICRTPRLDIGKRIDWLIRFPYGCIEQTTSAVFPQLYLKSFMKKSYDDEEDIDYNINTAIKRLRKFQLANGSFTYWPGNLRTCEWGTNYAGHFLLEAKKLGYFVPQDMLANWIRYQRGYAKKNMNRDYYEKHKYTLKIQLYRLYLLALAESPEIGAMNYLKEDVLPVMDDTERWMLASAYNMAGVNTTAEQIALKTGIIVKDYTELAETYGSGLRDKAIILDALLIMNRKDKAEELYLDISDRLSSTDWFSTQTLGYSLLSLGKYIQANKEDFNMDSPLVGEITLANQEIIPFNSKEFSVKKNITDSFGEEIGVHIDSETKLSNVYLNLNWDGVPLKPTEEEKSNGLKLKISWFDINGNSIDPSIIKQGEVFKAKIQVEKTINRTLENIALVQILPSGWEIENERINPDNIQTEKPKNKFRTKTANVDYTDIRDDRIMWFFNMIRNEDVIEVEVKLRAVTIGEFELPPTLCEVMYDNKYQCIKAGRKVSVVK